MASMSPLQEFNQLEDTATIPPSLANQIMYMEHKHNEDLEPDLQVIQNSPEEEEHSADEDQPISDLLEHPTVNIMVGDPPLRLSETTEVVEREVVTEDVNNPTANDELGDHMISVSEAAISNNTEQQRPTVKRQESEHKSQSNHLGNLRWRLKSSGQRPLSDNLSPTRASMKSSSDHLSRKSIGLSTLVPAGERQAAINNQTACTVGEKVMVETRSGFKFGDVKFVGQTHFASGEWTGVALERPNGELVIEFGYILLLPY